MTLYSSGKFHNKYETSFKYMKSINCVKDLKELVSRYDYCMALFDDGYTQNGKFVKCHRYKDDFLESDCLYVDVDNEGKTLSTQYTIEDFQDQFKKYEYYISTSKSHQLQKKNEPPLDRFHVFFPIHVVTDGEVLKEYLRILHEKFFKLKTMDRSCIDSARFFYGAKNTKVYYNNGKSIGTIIHKLYELKPKISPKPQVKISNCLQSFVIKCLDKAHELKWFDDYYDWLKLGIALKNSGYDIEVWQKYCYTDEDIKETEKKWKGFRDGSVGMNHLSYICRKMMR